ncbi:MAG: hypothetical protein NTW06_03460 [Candidatus Falkowbacteria bacterium]|nr:hypothetical protein [Candidatus Falkowbacteria bacterium]
MFKFFQSKKNQQGVAMLLAIVLLTAAILVIATSVFFLGLGELDMGYTYQCGEETFALADGCMEETLRRIKINPGYYSGNLDLGKGKCIIKVSDGVANQKIISLTASSTVNNCNKRITATSTISNNEVIVTAWSEQ